VVVAHGPARLLSLTRSLPTFGLLHDLRESGTPTHSSRGTTNDRQDLLALSVEAVHYDVVATECQWTRFCGRAYVSELFGTAVMHRLSDARDAAGA
jgi:hypothetical protein